MKTVTVKLTFLLVLAALVLACDGNNNEPSTEDNSKDRKVILTHWADNIIIPSYSAFQAKLDIMVSKNSLFQQTPGITTLAELRAAWVDAYLEWQKVELFEFGPADRYTMRNFFNIYPTDIAGISENINNANANLDVPAAYARQGFPALDYLLNGVAADDAAIVAFYTTSDDASKNLAYLNRIVTRMDTILESVVSEWTTYRETFISKTGLDIGSSMGLVVNAYVLNYERYIRSGKIGIPSGSTITAGGVAYPEKVEAYYKKDISRDLAKNAHQASLSFFKGINVASGSEGPSFKSYLDALGAKDANSGTALSDIINQQFNTITTELAPLSPNLAEQVQNDNDAMKAVYTEMQKVVRMIKVDMTSAMSITITYTDNDGD